MTDNITVETINGKKCTVIWIGYTPKDAEYKTKRLGTPDGVGYHAYNGDDIIAITLPALPRHPKPEHAKLLYRYCAEGLTPVFSRNGNYIFKGIVPGYGVQVHKNGDVHNGYTPSWETIANAYCLTHCVTETGQRVDVAIEGEAK